MKIAVLYTCFNRKEKTLSSLIGLYQSLEIYNNQSTEKIEISVFLTDDGCTDGTANAIRQQFPEKSIVILQGTGNLYWAGGMRYAWKEALKRHDEWSFYLLVNDDTDIFGDCINELIETHNYCISKYHKAGIYSGVTCAKSDMNITTYGGNVRTNKFWGTTRRIVPNGMPQEVDATNANILLVSKEVVDKIGIFYEGYQHGIADVDYSLSARDHGIPLLITGHHCGTCDNDHIRGDALKKRIISMTQKERTAYFRNPLHSNKDYLLYIRRHIPVKYPFTWILRKLHERCPKLYYRLNHGQ